MLLLGNVTQRYTRIGVIAPEKLTSFVPENLNLFVFLVVSIRKGELKTTLLWIRQFKNKQRVIMTICEIIRHAPTKTCMLLEELFWGTYVKKPVLCKCYKGILD